MALILVLSLKYGNVKSEVGMKLVLPQFRETVHVRLIGRAWHVVTVCCSISYIITTPSAVIIIIIHIYIGRTTSS
jgi:hypothetical protein